PLRRSPDDFDRQLDPPTGHPSPGLAFRRGRVRHFDGDEPRPHLPVRPLLQRCNGKGGCVMGASGKRLLGLHAWLVFALLYLPIVVLVAFSFNASRLNVVWEGFTLQWYGEMVRDAAIVRAARNSLIVATVSTIVSTLLGTLTAFALARHRFRWKRWLEGLLYIPIILPEIVMGISLLAFFALVGMRLSLTTMIIAHITFCAAFVSVVVRARLHGLDRTLERAAMDLGANEWRTFWKVTFPLVSPGIIAGALIAFTLS